MKKLLIGLVLLLSSCTADYLDEGSKYDCGVIVGGEVRGREYWLLISYPDGEWWHRVTQKVYEEYRIFDDICFGVVQW